LPSENTSNCRLKSEDKIKQIVSGKNVLFVATTYLEYLRIQQELTLIKDNADSVEVIVGQSKYYILRLLYVYWRLLTRSIGQIDVVFIGFSPQLVLPFWRWKFNNKTIIIDFFISFYDTLVFDRKKFEKESLMANFLLKLDKATLSKADLIIADTKEHAKYFVKTLKAEGSKLLVLYLQADKKYYYKRNIQKAAEYKDKYVVFYFATVLPLQGVDIVIGAIAQTNHPDIHFVFVGPISKMQKEILFKQEQLSYHSWLPQNQLAEIIAQSDLCLAGHFNDQIEKAKRTIPGKAYIFEAMSKIIILGDNEANRERYPIKYSKVLLVKMGSVSALSATIKQLYRESFNANH
jgi:glycosyltransferase involved in cell wall biosynthesis